MLKLSESFQLTSKVGRCVVKDERMAPCGLPTVYLAAEQAQTLGYGTYSGYYHLSDRSTGHHAVPGYTI